MYKPRKANRTYLNVNKSMEGETIEAKIRRIVLNKEAITDGAPLVYTDRKDGVKPETDIRTDRFELAVDAMDKVAKNKLAKREERHKPAGEEKKTNPDGTTTKGESAQATEPKAD